MTDPLYSLRQVAKLTDTPIWTVRRWVHEQRIQVERVGPLHLKRIRVRHSVLVKLFPYLENFTDLDRSV